MRITLESGAYGWDFVIVAKDGRDVLIQTDWDYPSVANTFGWKPRAKRIANDETGKRRYCEHDFTDGTIDCRGCGRKAIEFIAEAKDFLDNHIGAEVDDPGYFDN